jgi:hypothetical protein
VGRDVDPKLCETASFIELHLPNNVMKDSDELARLRSRATGSGAVPAAGQYAHFSANGDIS